jgi:acyl-CoA thioester hydrolase
MREPFELLITVQTSDIDELDHVNNVVYVRWVQEVAAAHWNKVATPAMKEDYRWVVLRHEIDYRNAAFINDTIRGTTWVGEHHGARFERFVKLVSADDQRVLADAKTMWCMIDAKTGRPVRITDEILAIL